MGFLSAVGSFISGAISVVSSAIGSLGGALSGAVSNFLKIAGSHLNVAIQIIQIVSLLLNILNQNDNIEELGAKAIESDKKPEDFDSNAEYIDYLKNEVTLDHEKFEKASDIEKMARGAIGATIVVKGVEEKKGFDIPIETWIAMSKLDLKGTDKEKAIELDNILNTFNSKLEDFVKYTEGKLDIDNELNVKSKLKDMYSQLEPNMSSDNIEKKIMKMEVSDK